MHSGSTPWRSSIPLSTAASTFLENEWPWSLPLWLHFAPALACHLMNVVTSQGVLKLFHFKNKPWALVFWEEASHNKVNTWHPTPQLDVPAVCRNLLGLIYWCHSTPIPGILKQRANVISCEKSKNKPKTLSQRKFCSLTTSPLKWVEFEQWKTGWVNS